MKKIRRIGILIIVILLINCLFFSCYAESVKVTKENLSEALKKFSSSESNEENYEIKISDDDITITTDEKDYKMSYDLTENPKFVFEVPIKKGMNYKDFEDQTQNMVFPVIGYIAVANIHGVEFEDSSSYLLMMILNSAMDGSFTSDNSYVIVDDTNSEGGEINKDESSSNVIYASEFGEKVMEYVNSVYKEKQTLSDKSGINSYEWIVERKEVTSDSCKLVSTLTVNNDADFSKIEEYSNQMNDDFLNKDITQDNADYKIKLKVGQKCKFESTEEITGYEYYGSGCDIKKLNSNCVEITGVKVGKANGYIYLNEVKKSFYVTVEENTENKSLDELNVNVNSKPSENKPTDGNNPTNPSQQQQQTQQKPQNSQPKDNTVTKEKTLPKTGISSNTIKIVIIFVSVLLIVFGIKLIKYRDIK